MLRKQRKNDAKYPYSRGINAVFFMIMFFALMMTGCSNKEKTTGPSELTNAATVTLDALSVTTFVSN